MEDDFREENGERKETLACLVETARVAQGVRTRRGRVGEMEMRGRGRRVNYILGSLLEEIENG